MKLLTVCDTKEQAKDYQKFVLAIGGKANAPKEVIGPERVWAVYGKMPS